jgi:hypothetical protein
MRGKITLNVTVGVGGGYGKMELKCLKCKKPVDYVMVNCNEEIDIIFRCGCIYRMSEGEMDLFMKLTMGNC